MGLKTDWFSVLTTMILLATFPFAVVGVVGFFIRHGWSVRAARRWRTRRSYPVVGRLGLRQVAMPLALALAILAWFAARVLEELLRLPSGSWVALMAIVLGVAAGLAAFARPRWRPLVYGAIVAGGLAVVVAVLFSVQHRPLGGERRSADYPSGAGATTAPSVRGTEPPRAGMRAEHATDPQVAPAWAPRPDAVLLGVDRRYVAPGGVCLADHGSTRLRLWVSSPELAEAMLPNGAVVSLSDLGELRPCSQPDGAGPLELPAPGWEIEHVGGRPFPTGTVTVRVLAELLTGDGEPVLLVWRRDADRIAYVGVVPDRALG